MYNEYKFRQNLEEAISVVGGSISDEELDKFMELNYDEDSSINNWSFSDYYNFAKKIVDVGIIEASKDYDFNASDYDDEDDCYDEDEDDDHNYEYMTDDKYDTLDSVLTLRELLSVDWNSVRNSEDNNYPILWDAEDAPQEDLDRLVKTEDHYEEDGDGYPIIYYKFYDSNDDNEDENNHDNKYTTHKCIKNITVAEVISMLNEYPQDAQFLCCGANMMYIHSNDKIVSIDTDDCYDDEYDTNYIDDLYDSHYESEFDDVCPLDEEQ